MPVTHGVTGSSPVRTAKSNGTLTEWLGSGLQNRVQQFESAGYLTHERAHHQLGDVLSFRISANCIISILLM